MKCYINAKRIEYINIINYQGANIFDLININIIF